MSKENNNKVMIMLPGEQVASIEEFEGGKNTYLTQDGTIRSAAIGTKAMDLKRRVIKIEPKNAPMLPKIGDILVGYVEMIFASMISVKVLYINGVESTSGFSAIASMRVGGGGRDRRERPIFRTGDIIRGRVMSLLNSTVHMTIAEREFGVLYTTCFMCGGDTVKVNDTVKCIECGAWEPRKLTNDYGKETLRQIFRAGGSR
ncbi:putative RNA-binding protein (consists of S1 domain and a Zn-ribbon domain) [Candidatus Nitrososphaera evergladensis SR1]|uniref:Exosome complex component Csl4 n=1 Tax=Candidatus Nitrososphaera evergladensis SR1 TaxID=1459636 RepID=A0A075MVS2_9ARCH|nr:exosome complex RNA-binding protein Csl4 [Candidatus Nitrososphaera evergladensis]AIF85238.1 putative RNA-binding protein (consists of S1 domain and a Zn-ribbon domain) [Candidatus Nitrososphaera evergladensis SR1]